MSASTPSNGPQPGGPVEATLRDALELGDQERWDEMAELLTEALESHPDDAYLLGWLGVAEGERGRDGVAYEYFRRCLEEEPVDPQLLALAGSGLAAFDDPEAEHALRAAALSGPDISTTRLQYGAYLSRAGLIDEALEQLRAALELDREDPVIHAELAAALALSGDHAAAAARMEEALALAPEDTWSRVILGLLYMETEDVERAAEHLVHAASERTDDPEAQVLAALAATAAGWEGAAQDAIARAPYGAEGADAAMIDEAETAIAGGAEPARRMLRSSIGPSALRDRLMEPL